jgi:hypothetical protein
MMNNLILASITVILSLAVTVGFTVAGLRGKNAWWGWTLVSGAGFMFALTRAVLFHVNWTFIRPLNGGWMALFVLLVVGTPVLFALKLFNAAKLIACASLALAFLLPVDFFNSTFWSSWSTDGAWGWGAMFALALALWIIVSKVFGKWLGFAILAAYLLLTLTSTLGVGSAPSASATVSASATSTSGATPAATPSVTATSASPSPSPSPTQTETSSTVKELRATEGSVIGWDNVTALVDKQDAAWWPKLLDDNQSKLRFSWDDVKNWSKARLADGTAIGARVIVVFDADTSVISDGDARKIAGIDSTKVDIVRATGCYTLVSNDKEVCPTGDQRVVTFIAPVVKDGSKIKLRAESGVVLMPSDDDQVVLEPATYVVHS